MVRADGFRDSWVLAGHDESVGATCPAGPDGPEENAGRIDYILVHDSLAGRVREAWIDTDCIASDHHPYWADLDL